MLHSSFRLKTGITHRRAARRLFLRVPQTVIQGIAADRASQSWRWLDQTGPPP